MTKVMGILNVTPDSFYDGGEYNQKEKAVEHAEKMVEEGADIIDVGGESTRPGADPVPVKEELERVVPVVEEIASLDTKISIDTRKPEVAEKALKAGADIVNDVTGLEKSEMRQLVVENSCKAILMDSVNIPVDRSSFEYGENVVKEVKNRLQRKAEKAREAGISGEQIIIDPGIGFGKKPEQDAKLIANTDKIKSLGYPVMVGCSRKSFFKSILELPQEERLEPSIAANVIAAMKGADIVRVHDVEETVKAVRAAALIVQHEY